MIACTDAFVGFAKRVPESHCSMIMRKFAISVRDPTYSSISLSMEWASDENLFSENDTRVWIHLRGMAF